MIATVECQPKVSISRHLLFVGRFRAMNLGELKEIFDSAGLPLVNSTSSTTGHNLSFSWVTWIWIGCSGHVGRGARGAACAEPRVGGIGEVHVETTEDHWRSNQCGILQHAPQRWGMDGYGGVLWTSFIGAMEGLGPVFAKNFLAKCSKQGMKCNCACFGTVSEKGSITFKGKTRLEALTRSPTTRTFQQHWDLGNGENSNCNS